MAADARTLVVTGGSASGKQQGAQAPPAVPASARLSSPQPALSPISESKGSLPSRLPRKGGVVVQPGRHGQWNAQPSDALVAHEQAVAGLMRALAVEEKRSPRAARLALDAVQQLASLGAQAAQSMAPLTAAAPVTTSRPPKPWMGQPTGSSAAVGQPARPTVGLEPIVISGLESLELDAGTDLQLDAGTAASSPTSAAQAAAWAYYEDQQQRWLASRRSASRQSSAHHHEEDDLTIVGQQQLVSRLLGERALTPSSEPPASEGPASSLSSHGAAALLHHPGSSSSASSTAGGRSIRHSHSWSRPPRPGSERLQHASSPYGYGSYGSQLDAAYGGKAALRASLNNPVVPVNTTAAAARLPKGCKLRHSYPLAGAAAESLPAQAAPGSLPAQAAPDSAADSRSTSPGTWRGRRAPSSAPVATSVLDTLRTNTPTVLANWPGHVSSLVGGGSGEAVGRLLPTTHQ